MSVTEKKVKKIIYLPLHVFYKKKNVNKKLYLKNSSALEKVPDPEAVAPYTLINQCCRIWDPVPFSPVDLGSGMGKKSRSGYGDTRSYFRELTNNFLG
jgi:hypothetical protein